MRRSSSRLSDINSAHTVGEVPVDGVYFRAPGVTASLRSFPENGPINCYLDNFKNVDAFSKKVPHRLLVPKDYRNWTIPYDEYEPIEYITESVLANCRNRNPWGYADPEPIISVMDPHYSKLFKPFNPIWLRGLLRDTTGTFLHPYGRVGIKGQGTLGNRQINEAIDPVTVYLDPTTGIVKVLLIKRNPRSTIDSTWAVPGGMVDFKPENGTYTLPNTLRKTLTDMRMSIHHEMQDSDNNFKENALRELNEETGFKGHVSYQKLIAQMYCDDSRTTDTAWIGTTVFLLVPERCETVQADGVETAEALWVPIIEAMDYEFFASHRYIVTAALRYYVTNSFHDRKQDGSEEHRMAYEYLKPIPELDINQTFEGILMDTAHSSSICLIS